MIKKKNKLYTNELSLHRILPVDCKIYTKFENIPNNFL